MGVINTLANRAYKFYDQEHLKIEEDHLVDIFKGLFYKEDLIRKTITRTKGRINMRSKDKKEVLTK